jgi:large subunit ribosomal protein L10
LANESIVAKKQAYVEELSQKMSNSVAGVIVSYSGINVADDTMLRRKLREAGVEYTVVKNTLLHRAAEKIGLSDLDSVLNGSTALALSETDHVAAAKILCEYAEKNNKFFVKAGFVEGKAINEAEVKELAQMPPKEVLVAKVLGGFNAPITGFVGVLNANLRGLVVALNAIAEQKTA